MNYLSHHVLARAALPDAPPLFYVGNVLPDLLGASGDGKLRSASVAVTPPGVDPDLARGIRLHIESDRRFHSLPEFAAATARASEALREASFATPLRRVFFLAHAFVEIALDGTLIRENPSLAADFYSRFAQGDLERAVADTARLTQSEGPLLGLARTLAGFLQASYLYSYARPEGLAEALSRVAQRAGLKDLLTTAEDRATLAERFAAFLPTLAEARASLLAAPEASLWYNSGEISQEFEGDDRRAD